jgi:hypothetical protein
MDLTKLVLVAVHISKELTLEKKFENGKPLSFENTQMSLEADANILNIAKNTMMVGMRTKKVVAPFEFVAS